MSTLFDSIQIGDFSLVNRIIMAPMTRNRSGKGRIPTSQMTEYYGQRADSGMIITEATSVSPDGVGYPHTPGIWTKEQVEGWKKVTRAVHAKGGKILSQLWHVGRISDPIYHNGALPVAPSAIALQGNVSLLQPSRPYPTPRALEENEIPVIISAFKNAAENALLAGFDGVEIHGANGYLLDQFLNDSSNIRIDNYGGSIENRARLMIEVVDAVMSVWGAGRVGLHLSPRGDSQILPYSYPAATFNYVAKEMGKRQIAFLCTRESIIGDRYSTKMKNAFGGVLIANEGFTQESANAIISSGEADAVAFGTLFIANPDLVSRFRNGYPLNSPSTANFYSDGEIGYTDYPNYG